MHQLEDENLSIEKQERDKEEKLNRTQYQLRKALKRLGSRDTSIYAVSIISLKKMVNPLNYLAARLGSKPT